jgi:hypothetical protein
MSCDGAAYNTLRIEDNIILRPEQGGEVNSIAPDAFSL